MKKAVKKIRLISLKVFKRISKVPKRFLIPVVVVLLLLANFALSRGNNKVEPQFAEVKKMDLKQVVSSSGVLAGKDDLDLKFRTGGKLSYINVTAGDSVSRWQVIAGLDTTELLIDLRTAQNTLRDKRAIVDKIHDDLKDVTAESFTQRQTRTTAEVAQDNAYEGVLAAQKALYDATIFSPIDGIITNVNVIPGQVVTAADVIAHVANFSQIIFKSDVDESDIPKVSLGQDAQVTLNAYGDRVFKGTVVEIEPETRTTSGGAIVVTVKISLENTDVAQIRGLNGQVDIVTAEKDNVLAIPLEALRGSDTVFVKTELGIKPKKVVAGFKTDTDVEIEEGLNEGDRVVVNQTESVKNLRFGM